MEHSMLVKKKDIEIYGLKDEDIFIRAIHNMIKDMSFDELKCHFRMTKYEFNRSEMEYRIKI